MTKNPQPLFFEEPVPLMAERHEASGLSKEANYKFARTANSVPLNAPEFAEACKYYAIGFANDAASTPVALTGFRKAENLFVDKEGNWRRNTYIPAYVRRYPFAFMARENKLILCVDEKSSRFLKKAKKTDMKFFEGKEQTALVKNALEFCRQFHRDSTITAEFGRTLRAQGLLIDQQATFNLAGEKTPAVLGGFSVVDQNKFMNLPANIVTEWHKNGFLALINLHMLSLGNIAKLPEMAGKSVSKKVAAKKLNGKKR